MPRLLRVALAALAALVALAALGGVAAASPQEVAGEIDANGYHVEDGAEPVDQAALAAAVADAREAGERLGVALLADDPGQGAFGFADQVLDNVASDTVLVLTPAEVGASSVIHDDRVIDGALDRAAPDFAAGGDVAAGVATFAEELAVRAGGGTAASPTGGGLGGLGLGLFVVGVVLLAGMSLVSGVRQRRRLRTRGQADLATARMELRRQNQAVADDILSLSDKLMLTDSTDANTEYAKATEAYQSVLGAAESATNLAALAEVADDVDRARWHLEAARAAADGEVPRRSAARSACFFDPVHGAGSEEATLQADGRDDLAVRVCRACADVLRAGGHPAEHRVTVGFRELPAVMAPRGFGGAELSWLGEFRLVPRGGDPVAFDWSRYGGRLPAVSSPRTTGTGAGTDVTTGPRRRRTGWGWGYGGWGWGGYYGPRRHRGHRGWGGGWGGTGGWTGGAGRGGASRGRPVSRGGGSTSRGGASRGGGSRSRGSRGGGSRRR